MTRLNEFQRILRRLEYASRNIQHKFPQEKYVLPPPSNINTTKEDLMKQINTYISFLENREYSHLLFKRKSN